MLDNKLRKRRVCYYWLWLFNKW